MARRPNDASGTVWVHDPPSPSPGSAPPEAEAAPYEPPPVERPPAPTSQAPAPVPYVVTEEPSSSGGMSTGCLVLLFAMGGVGLGLAVLLLLGLAGGIVYSMQAAG